MSNIIWLYGLGGAEDMYRVVDHVSIKREEAGIREMKLQAMWMRQSMPSIKLVYAIDQRPGLAQDYKNAWRKNPIESHAIFKDILEREGNLIT